MATFPYSTSGEICHFIWHTLNTNCHKNRSGVSEIQSVRRFRNSIGQVFQKFNRSGVSEIQPIRCFRNSIGQVFKKFNRSGVSEIQSVRCFRNSDRRTDKKHADDVMKSNICSYTSEVEE